jgi:hypothetical protein
MPLNLLPMSALGAVESNGAVTFGLWLPWVSAGDGNALTVKIIHEADQFLEGVPAREFSPARRLPHLGRHGALPAAMYIATRL